jgi:hypothetical protein
MGADLIVSFATPGTDVPGIFYFASTLSHSEAGRALAESVAAGLGVAAVGRSMPILKETRAPAIVVSAPRLDAPLGGTVVAALEAWFAARVQDQPASDR